MCDTEKGIRRYIFLCEIYKKLLGLNVKVKSFAKKSQHPILLHFNRRRILTNPALIEMNMFKENFI